MDGSSAAASPSTKTSPQPTWARTPVWITDHVPTGNTLVDSIATNGYFCKLKAVGMDINVVGHASANSYLLRRFNNREAISCQIGDTYLVAISPLALKQLLQNYCLQYLRHSRNLWLGNLTKLTTQSWLYPRCCRWRANLFQVWNLFAANEIVIAWAGGQSAVEYIARSWTWMLQRLVVFLRRYWFKNFLLSLMCLLDGPVSIEGATGSVPAKRRVRGIDLAMEFWQRKFFSRTFAIREEVNNLEMVDTSTNMPSCFLCD